MKTHEEHWQEVEELQASETTAYTGRAAAALAADPEVMQLTGRPQQVGMSGLRNMCIQTQRGGGAPYLIFRNNPEAARCKKHSFEMPARAGIPQECFLVRLY
ncbi:hypothetical protein R50912_22080 [Paenibacillus sp. FSL R5-0912]|nr:hypothetical protein R50912_22080 [Paenibacillus sp. FSL R5-0912]